MKHKTKKGLAAAMTAALLVSVCTVCTGCGSRKGSGATLEVSFDHSYSSQELKLEGATRTEGGISLGGDSLLIVGSDEDYNELFYLYNMTDGSSQEIKLAYRESLGKDEEAWPAAYFLNPDGGMSMLYSAYSFANDEYKNLGYTLETYDSQMNAVETKKLDIDENLSFNEIQIRPQGGYYATIWDDTGNPSVSILDDDFKVKKKISGNFSYIQTLFTMPDGTAYVAYQDNEYNNVFGKVNEDFGSVEKVEIEGLPSWFNECFASKTEDYDFYITNSEAIFGINVENGTCTEVVNWLNSDFSGDYVNSPMQLDDGRFLISCYDSNYSSSSMWLLSPRDPEELKNIEVISLATLYTSSNLSNAVSEFNRSSDKYRIVVYDYNQFNSEDDWEAGQKKFESDMTSGIVADIICVSNLPFETLCSKGLFYDLNDYADSLTEDKYFTNYFKSLEYGGKLYRMGFSFSVRSMMAKTEHVGEGTKTISEYTELLKNLPEGMEPFTNEMAKDDALYQLVISNTNSFVNVETATCTFNSPEFIELLEFCDTFPMEAGPDYSNMDNSDWQSYWEVQDYRFINDMSLFNSEYIYDIDSAYRSQMQYFDTAPVTRTGFPVTGEGDNGGRFSDDYLLSISTNSKYKDECWSFFEMILSDEYQEKLSWMLPVSKSAFDKAAEKAMEPNTYTDENGKEVVVEEYSVWRGSEEFKVPLMTQAYVDDLKSYISGITQTSYYNQKIYEIVSEEADMFFAGDQTAQQAADMIQSRASLYLSEQQ